jgi:hypothetical protein
MNLFLESMDTDKVSAIQETKENKSFVLSLIRDLDKVFHTNFQIEDNTDSTTIRIKASSNNNNYGSYTFSANKNGINFNANCLGYYSVKSGNDHIKPLGKLYEKYKDIGTTADANFLAKGDRSGFGWVNFKIPIYRSDLHINLNLPKLDNKERLLDTLKDIIYILEHNSYTKRF